MNILGNFEFYVIQYGSLAFLYMQAMAAGSRELVYLQKIRDEEEMRNQDCRKAGKLLSTLERGMKEAGLEYVDLWRITMNEQSGQHTEAEVDEMMQALQTAKAQGKARFLGFS